MDWYSWLCKTGLEPSLVYEYGLAFAHNELQYEDITYFNHEFLQSIGISIGKHRLEILKLAKKERGDIPNFMSRFLQLINRTKRRFSKYIMKLGYREELALALVPKRNCSSRWKNGMLKRNKRVGAAKQTTLLLTNGSPVFMSDSRMNSFLSPMLYDDFPADEKMGADYWTSSVVEDIRSEGSWMVRKIIAASGLLQQHQSLHMPVCSIRQLYLFQIGQLPRVPWKNLTAQNYARPKAVFNLWLVLHDRLPTKDKLLHWGMTVDNICVLCQQAPETRDRLFHTCPFAIELRGQTLSWIREDHSSMQNWEHFIQWIVSKAKGKSSRANIFKMVVAELFYALWLERNARIF